MSVRSELEFIKSHSEFANAIRCLNGKYYFCYIDDIGEGLAWVTQYSELSAEQLEEWKLGEKREWKSNF